MNGPNNPIGWCDYTYNPVKGKCPVACPYCYARRIYDRFKWDPTVRLDRIELLAPYKLKKPAKIFVGSTIELFGELVNPWMEDILKVVKDNPRHTFQFLTQIPEAMRNYTFPENCWCGTTMPIFIDRNKVWYLSQVKAKIHFFSFEPLHGCVSSQAFSILNFTDINWFIIGAETGNRKGKIVPQEKWIADILRHADAWSIPVFMKDNLKPYWHGELRQEFPE